MHRSSWLSELVDRCQASGLDLVQPFGLSSFHAVNAPELHLETFGRENALAVVIGNTRALWQPFLEAVAASNALAESAHPLDQYVAGVVARALETAPSTRVVYFEHRRNEKLIAIQRIADAAGLAELGPAHLSVHPVHGPWIALRAVVVFDEDFDDARHLTTSPPMASAPFDGSHCQTCAQPCVDALDRALAQTRDLPNYGLAPQPLEAPPSGTPQEASVQLEAALGPQRLAWLALRDACPVGRASRYDSAQIAYHYGKFRALLAPKR